LAIIAVEAYAIQLTESRGGIISILAGALVLLCQRFGWKKTIFFAVIPIAALSLISSGRQLDLSASSGTAQARVQLWGSSLQLFASHPFLGVGPGMLAELIGHVAHNSFLQCYAELGWIGGTVFLSIFALSVWMLLPQRLESRNVELMRLRPYLLAANVAYIGGMLVSVIRTPSTAGPGMQSDSRDE
jgi:putative inorganic carbon (HCO3(-)) transporter